MKRQLDLHKILTFILFIFVLLEILCSTHFVGKHRSLYIQTSIPHFILGLFIGLIPLYRAPSNYSINGLSNQQLWYYLIRGLTICFFIGVSIELIRFSHKIFSIVPVDVSQADMMPIIRVMCQRFISGEEIYAPIPEIWGGVDPIYLPAMWGAFVPFELMGVDIRWGSVVGILLSILLILGVFWHKKYHNKWVLLTFIPLFFWAQGLWQEQTYLIRFAEEGVVIFYYTLLAFAIANKNPYLIGFGIALCILSRYGLLFWVPFYLLFVYLYESKKNAFIITGTSLFLGVVFFLIPYGIERFDFFISIPSEYPDYARRLWEQHPDFFTTTLGLAKYFSAESVTLQQRIHLVSIFCIPMLLFLGFWKWERTGVLNKRMWAICSLKLTMALFYNLIVVPVLYLFWVSTVLSVIVLAIYLRRET